MALKKSLILFPMLALMLLVLGWVHPSQGQETQAMRFRRQHIDPDAPDLANSTYCDVMMVRRNMTLGACKSVNTFVHASLSVVNAVCNNNFTACTNGSNICHQSTSRMILTNCVLKRSSIYPKCEYWTNPVTQYIVVKCEGNPYVPVHFDRRIEIST